MSGFIGRLLLLEDRGLLFLNFCGPDEGSMGSECEPQPNYV